MPAVPRILPIFILAPVLTGSIFAQSLDGWTAKLVEKENLVEAQAKSAAWQAAPLGLELAIRDRLRTGEFSRAAVRFSDLSVLRVDELTTIQVTPPVSAGGRQTLEVQKGGTYFYSREKAQEIQIRTPAANGALRGTEFELRVAGDGKTRLTMFDGEVELSNAHGKVVVGSGEQAVVEVGSAPRKTAVIDAVNIIQWCLYYPGVLDPEELGLGAAGKSRMSAAVKAYQQGDLLGALKALPQGSGGSPEEKVFRAATILSTGQVDKAVRAMAGVPENHPGRQALEQVIAAVKSQTWSRAEEPKTAGEWMAKSYYLQSRSDLEGALKAARKATELRPDFGFAWTRLAELEFSFGRTPRAMKWLERGLELSPRHAQAHALQGFLLSGQNRLGAARRSFEQAMECDGALANAWLGRGLISIRQGETEEGRRDLQTAVALEPNRSILRSYLGKAFSQEGNAPKANLELERAKTLDPNDPTPPLYTAVQRKQENRYNEAIDELEQSLVLNKNRGVYRSDFLLDQDEAMRGTNLAAIYENNGMVDQSIREAVRAVGNDYGSANAHLFLANSYNALRDPSGTQLRYESAWSSELLLSHLLSPVGGGPLSQFVSEQEYSKMFESDGLGLSSLTEYYSDGRFREVASQFGTFGNVSYALDAKYFYDDGLRPNNKISWLEAYATFKLQVTSQDTLFFQVQYNDRQQGNRAQYYDPRVVGRETSVEVETADGGWTKQVTKNTPANSYDLRELQEPAQILAGWHHEWSPGNHTLLLLGRSANDSVVKVDQQPFVHVFRDIEGHLPLDKLYPLVFREIPLTEKIFSYLKNRPNDRITAVGVDPFDLQFSQNFEVFSAELQQILTTGPNTLVLGSRFQRGEFESKVTLSNHLNGVESIGTYFYGKIPIEQEVMVDFERLSLYAYDTLRLAPWLSVTGGIVYDSLRSPQNADIPPVNDKQDSTDEVSPKVGLFLTPWRGATVRASYTESLGGSSFEQDIRLEPNQVSGFLQTYRNLASGSLVSASPGAKYKLSGLSFEQKLPTRTYLGIEYNVLREDADRTIGTFDVFNVGGGLLGFPTSELGEKLIYREDVLVATANQLVGDRWALGARYQYTHSSMRQIAEGFSDGVSELLRDDFQVTYNGDRIVNLARYGERRSEGDLHQVSLFTVYNHPNGFFARAEANWYHQELDNFVKNIDLPTWGDTNQEPHPRVYTENLGLPGEDFWQFNFVAGYRFYRNQAELSCGFLNMTGEDYRLDPLSPYLDLPRDRTFMVRCKLAF